MPSDGLTARPATLRQCAILAGGLATRLGARAATTPKPLLPCGDRPFLAWSLRELARFGVERVLLLTGHLSGAVDTAVASLAAALPRPMQIALSTEPAPAGTAGALFHARDRLDPRFLLLNGDSLLDGNLAALLAAAAADDAGVLGRLALAEVADAGRYGAVTLAGDRITGFRERPEGAGGAGWVSGGVYALDRRIVDDLPARGSLERDVLPRLAIRGALRATRLPGWFIDIGVPADLARAGAALPARLLRRRALFLDRDGVINRDLGYVGSRDRFHWTEGAREAIRAASDAGWHVFVVTNQSGVARGHYDEDAVTALHRWMADAVRRAGGTIDDIRYCPHHPEAPLPAYRRACACRKPAPGMLRALLRAWQLDPADCVLVGDQPSDLQAAVAAGVRGVAFAGGDLRATVAPLLAGRDGHQGGMTDP